MRENEADLFEESQGVEETADSATVNALPPIANPPTTRQAQQDFSNLFFRSNSC